MGDKQVLRILDSFAMGIQSAHTDEAVKQVTSMSATGIGLIINIEHAVGYQKGKKEGFEDLARRVEDISAELTTDPRQALAVIVEWIGDCRDRDKADS